MKRADNPFKYMLWQFEPYVQDVTVQYENYPPTTLPFPIFMKTLTTLKATLNLKYPLIYTVSPQKKLSTLFLNSYNTSTSIEDIYVERWKEVVFLNFRTFKFIPTKISLYTSSHTILGDKVYVTISKHRYYTINGIPIKERTNSCKFMSLGIPSTELKMLAIINKVDNK